ncbi:MAG: hypothetical protein PF501_09285 [Salinisphaera sp.]|nr:hypothetical protein [Salinisphaera sp.]
MLEPKIQHIVQIQVAQQNADRTALRCTRFVGMHFTFFQYAGFQPSSYQADDARITDPVFNKAQQPFMIQAAKEVLHIGLQHPAHPLAGNRLIEGCQCMMRAATGSTAKRTGQEVLFVDGRQHVRNAALKRPVTYTGHAQRAFVLLAGLGDIHPPDRRCLIPAPMNRSQHGLNPLFELRFGLVHRDPITTGGRAVGNLVQIRLHPCPCDVMGQ